MDDSPSPAVTDGVLMETTLADALLGAGDHSPAHAAETKMSQVQQLLQDLDELTPIGPQAERKQAFQDKLASVRLGMAASLFAALRCKHPPTAAHSLRVALGCSTWALSRKMSQVECDQLEVAALLHDIGKVGVPDDLLIKPARLTDEEAAVMNRHRRMGLYILLSCCASTEVLHVVGNAPAWFDGNLPGYELSGRSLPLGARMLSIVDAFDSMTTDHVWRPAMPRERAFAELFRHAGTQFDPDLVQEFSELQTNDLSGLRAAVGRRWLESLQPKESNTFWSFNAGGMNSLGPAELDPFALFHQKMLENMHDGIVFIDVNMQVLMWNRGAERLTGVNRDAVIQRQFSPQLMQFHNERGMRIEDDDCPVAYAINTGMQSLRRVFIPGRTGKPISVNVHSIPVVGPDGTKYGATLLLHDASQETSLEERCQQLHEKATKDPLTQVANRAEFARMHELFVQVHLDQHLPCSLIITDIDHFKRVNDTYLHTAGDEVLKAFAQLLKASCRPGDLVARYGGEEFCILCADCTSNAAARRAEEIRASLAQRPMEAIAGETITASFGVTEVQPGDTPESMLRRADRALFQAKELGRNRVVQLGDGIGAEKRPRKKLGWFARWFPRAVPELVLERSLETPVPLKVAVEKLRGFVADHEATLVSIEQNDLVLQVQHGRKSPRGRRRADHCVPLLVELSFSEQQFERTTKAKTQTTAGRTVVNVAIRPKRNRDRRRTEVNEQAQHVFVSLRSYLMANEISEFGNAEGVLSRASNMLTTWFGGKP